MEKSLQETYAPKSICYGCGPANPGGLHIKSFVRGEDVVMDWRPEKFHHAFRGILNGGIIGTLLDCHSNWTAAEFLMRELGMERPPPTVTAGFQVRFLRPTPMERLNVSARAIERKGSRATVEAALKIGETVTATFLGNFVAVGKGHPAYDRWK